VDDLQIYDEALNEDDVQFLFQNPGQTVGAVRLQAGDADMDLDFDQLDLVQVQIAVKYLTGEPATWGEGDWDGAPGGEPMSPPALKKIVRPRSIASRRSGPPLANGLGRGRSERT
jgi:hypothetical protein